MFGVLAFLVASHIAIEFHISRAKWGEKWTPQLTSSASTSCTTKQAP
jgi:hypothetical protein